jgi:hypothetical protein
VRKGASAATAAYHSLLSELATSWKRFGEDARRLKREVPDLARILQEAQTLQAGWENGDSYLRHFLASGQWGHDPLWNSMVRKATPPVCLHCCPASTLPTGYWAEGGFAAATPVKPPPPNGSAARDGAVRERRSDAQHPPLLWW